MMRLVLVGFFRGDSCLWCLRPLSSFRVFSLLRQGGLEQTILWFKRCPKRNCSRPGWSNVETKEHSRNVCRKVCRAGMQRGRDRVGKDPTCARRLGTHFAQTHELRYRTGRCCWKVPSHDGEKRQIFQTRQLNWCVGCFFDKSIVGFSLGRTHRGMSTSQ